MPFSRRRRITRRVKPKSVTRRARRGRSRMTMRKRAFPTGKEFVTITDEYRVDWLPNNAQQPIVILGDGNHTRAALIAGEFQQYKLMKVELVIEQNYNTYPENPISLSVDCPQLYHVNWKSTFLSSTQVTNLNTTFFDEIGVKPIRLTSNKTLVYQPYVINMVNNPLAPAGYGNYIKAPWIPTNVTATTQPLSTISHYGKLFYVDQVASSTVVGNAPRQYRVRCTWAFKGKNLSSLIIG